MLTQILPDLRLIVTGYSTIEELINFVEAFGAFPLDEGEVRHEFLDVIHSIINSHIKLLKANNIPLIEPTTHQEPPERPHIFLKKILDVQQKGKSAILKMEDVPKEIKDDLKNADPFPDAHAIEDLIALGKVLNTFGIINPSHCLSYHDYQNIFQLTNNDIPSMELANSFTYLVNLLTMDHEHRVLNETATTQQRVILLRNFLNKYHLKALGNWDEKLIHGVLVKYHLEPIFSRGWFDLLLLALPGTFITHLDFSVGNTPEGLKTLKLFKVILQQSNITHAKIFALAPSYLSVLCPALERSNLLSLWIPYSLLSQHDCDELIQTLPLCRDLVEFNISCSSFSHSGIGKELFTPGRLELSQKLISAISRSSIKYIDISGTFPDSFLRTILTIFAKNIPGSCIERITVTLPKTPVKERLQANELYEQLITPALARNVELRMRSLAQDFKQNHFSTLSSSCEESSQSYTPSLEDHYQQYRNFSSQRGEKLPNVEKCQRRLKAGCSLL